MKHFLRTIFALALVVAMMIPASLVASAADADIEINGSIVDTGIRYHITYDANGGNDGGNGPDVMPGHTDTVLAPADAGITRDGYDFTGWNTAPGGTGTSYQPGDTVKLDSDLTLYAQWKESPTPPKDPDKPVSQDTPKTGDNSNLSLWAGILLSSLTMVILLLWMDRRKKIQNEMQES